MDIYSFLSLFGGLAFFLYGMNVMSSNLEKMAGGSLESSLRKVTSNQLLCLVFGAGITVAIQSSSAVTVMLVGLVNSGIVPFNQTIGIILGSNIGTTLTSWIMTLMGVSSNGFSIMTLLNPKAFTPILGFVGIILRMVSKKEKKKDLGTILVGFSILMYGMQLMSNSMSGLQDLPQFNSILLMFSNPLLAVLASTLFTGVIQSSAATIGIVQALAMTSSITYQMAIPLVVGANIGTCVTSLISALSSNREAKKVVLSHLIINITGAVVILGAFAVMSLTGNGSILATAATTVSIALIHTFFNVLNTLIILPLKDQFAKLIDKLLPGGGSEKIHTAYLDDRLLNTPTIAVNECSNLTVEMAYIAEESVLKALSLINHFNEDVAKTIEIDEDKLDKYEDRLGQFLGKVAGTGLSDVDAARVAKMNHSLTNFERMSDHALNIHDCIIKANTANQMMSDEAKEEMKVVIGALSEILDMSVQAFINDDLELATKVEPLEEAIDALIAKCQDNYVKRLSNREVSIEMGLVLNDVLGNCERISDHCSNLGICVIEAHKDRLDAHKYLDKLKHDSKEFQAEFDYYKNKYSL